MTTLSAQTSPAIPWAEIHEEWREREQSALGVAVATVVGKDAHDGVHDLVFAERARGRGTVEATLDRAFAAASSAPGGMQLLALHVYGLCLAKWEKSEDYGRIRTVLDALGRVHDACSQGNAGDSPSARLLSVLFSQAQLLDLAMGVEEAMNCSCPVAMGNRARRIVDELEVLDAILEALPASDKTMGADLGELRDVARADAAASLDNFGNIVEVAAVVFQFAYPEVSGPPDFGRVLTRLAKAERTAALDDDVYASELRAHRATLEALKAHADRRQLWIDAAEVVYVYPFTLRGISPEETVDRALRGRITDRLERDKVRFRPAKAQNLELNDLWERAGRHEPGYSGACVALPKIRVETTAYEWLEGPDRDLAALWI